MENSNEIWQVDTGSQIYETDFDGLAQWIAEGSLLPQDKVRRGNLRWIEAQKVPMLYGFFNAVQLGANPSLVTTTTDGQLPQQPPPTTFNEFPPATTFNQFPPASSVPLNQFSPPVMTFNEPPPPTFYQELSPPTETNFCAIHTDAPAKYHCETCANYFCKACPNQNICPMCGAMCQALNLPQPAPQIFAPQPFNPPQMQNDVIADEVLKAANWFYWKAGLTIINSFIMMTGTLWAFFLGLSITQIFHGVAIGVTEEMGDSSGRMFHGIALILSLFCAGFVAMLGYFGRKGKRWALILGMIIFCFDAFLYLITFSIFGVIIHAIAIIMIAQGIGAAKKN